MLLYQEPTSPEIIQAASNATKTKTVTAHQRKSTSTQQKEGEGSKPDTEETQCSQDHDGESQMSSVTHSPPTFNSQSLFHARISMRKKRSRNGLEHHGTQMVSQLETPESPETEDGENDYFDALTTVEEDSVMETTTRDTDAAPQQHTHTMEQLVVESQMEEECSVSLLGDSKTLQLLPPPILPPPTPSSAPPPPPLIPSPHSYTRDTAATTGFDELESVDMEDELSVVFSPPTRPTEAQPLERKTDDSELSQPLQADGQLADTATTQESDSFDQLECLSDIGSSVGDSSITDCEVDFEDAFSSEDEVLADVGCVQTSIEVTVLDQGTVSDSEWNDLTVNSLTFLPPPDCREAPVISTLMMQDSTIQHSPEDHNSSFDCLERVEVNDEETASYMDHSDDSAVLHNTTTPPQSCTQQEHMLHGDLNNDDSWDLSDLEWDVEYLEHPTNTSPPLDDKSYIKLKYELATDRDQVMHLEANIVPDIMNESLTCDVVEEDFHWD